MIQNQTSMSLENGYQPFCSQHFIQEILRSKHHQNRINYRRLLTFEQFFGNYLKPNDKDQRFANDVLTFSGEMEVLGKLYKMQEVTKTIRNVVLNRVKKDTIAPFLTNSNKQTGYVSKVQRRYGVAAFQMPESNTMNTQQSEKKAKFKNTQIQKVIVSYSKPIVKDSFNKFQDFSSQIMGKAAQDLSKMIQNVYIPQQKKVNVNVKFPKYIQPKNNALKTKQFKKLLAQENISMIRSNQNQNHFTQNLLNYDDPEENYGLKKFKKNNPKCKPHKIPQKIKSIKLSQTLKQVSQTKKKEKHICLSPLTPKPVSISKNRWGWQDALNKCSRFSLKTRVSSSTEKKISASKIFKISPKSPSTKIKTNKIPKSPSHTNRTKFQ